MDLSQDDTSGRYIKFLCRHSTFKPLDRTNYTNTELKILSLSFLISKRGKNIEPTQSSDSRSQIFSLYLMNLIFPICLSFMNRVIGVHRRTEQVSPTQYNRSELIITCLFQSYPDKLSICMSKKTVDSIT